MDKLVLERPCAICGERVQLKDLNYWYGAGPLKPWEAEAWFCGPEHAHDYIKEKKKDV